MKRRDLILLAAGGSLALLLAALFMQIVGGYAPCKLCLWQRWPHVAAIAMGGIGFFAPLAIVAVLGGLAALTTAGLGLYHAGVEWKFWQGPTSCTGSGPGLSGLSGSDLLSTDLATPLVMCDDIVWAFLGLSMAGWNAVLSLALVAVWVAAVRRA